MNQMGKLTKEELKLGDKVAEYVFEAEHLEGKPNDANKLAAILLMGAYKNRSDKNERNYLVYRDRLLYNTSYSELSAKYGTTSNNLRALVKRINEWLLLGEDGYGPKHLIIEGVKGDDTLGLWYKDIYECCKLHGIDSIKIKGLEETCSVEDTPCELEYTELDSLGLSDRTYNSLRRAGITTIKEAEEQMDARYIRGLGEKSKKELVEKIRKYREKHKGE